jgi:hypothetical protein
LRNSTAAIEAIYNTLSVLPNYTGIQKAVEYSIVNLCVLSVNACLTNGAGDPEFIQKDRFNRLSAYLKSMVSIPLTDNEFIMNKISTEGLNSIKKLLL